jgi:two-component system phosphate regulon response regulator PhoB
MAGPALGGSRKTILIVEDEADLAETLEYNLQRDGHRTRIARDGRTAMAELAREPAPDLILLDLMLPDVSGTEICKHIREHERTRTVPVIMLTAKSAEIDRVVGFEVGADDYVVKPFSVRELMLRVRALLRRAERPAGEVEGVAPERNAPERSAPEGAAKGSAPEGAAKGSAPESSAPESITFDRLRVDPPSHRAWVDDREIHLTALEFRLLVAFVTRRGRVQTRDTLLADVWGIEADITTRTVDTHVKRLREKLGEAGSYIETLRGVGYRFRDRPPAGTPATRRP